jgi:pimeloyl-ACP methyl ester carboxylesterase
MPPAPAPSASHGIAPGLLGLPFSVIDRMLMGAARLAGARSHLVQLHSGLGHVLELGGSGSGPPLVMLHGLGSCSADYVPLMRILRKDAPRLYAPDLPGHGRASLPRGGMHPEPTLDALQESLEAVVHEPAVIFGNSLGGLAAIRYAWRRPERVRALVLVSPGGAPRPDHDLRAFMRGFQLADQASALEFVGRFLGRPHPFQAVMARGVRARMARPGTRGIITTASAQMLLEPDEVRELPMPTLIFWGDEDDVLPSEDRDFFQRNLPRRGSFLGAPGYGHAPYLDDATDFARQIRPFLRSIE